MRSLLNLKLRFQLRTREQQAFLNSLPKMKFTSDEELISNIRKLYEKREYIQDCEVFVDMNNRLENYLIKNNKCTVAHLQCYYKLKEMRMISPPFKRNLIAKHFQFLQNTERQLRSQHLQKFLWFLFDENRFERRQFKQIAQLHTIKLFQAYQYMNTLADLPTWQPYVRIATMLRYLGHQIYPHKALGHKVTLDKIDFNYYPHIGNLFSLEEMRIIENQHKYDTPYLTHLCNQYQIKNTSRYDGYLQRVQWIQIEQVYERVLDVLAWSQLPPFFDLALRNHNANGAYDDIEHHASELFFRLCEHTDIEIQTTTQILHYLTQNPTFFTSRKFPIISRCSDSIFNQNIDQYSYLPAEAYCSLLKTSKKLDLDKNSLEYLQRFLCKKVEGKLIWQQGDSEALEQVISQCVGVKGKEIAGGLELVTFLKARSQSL